MPSICLKLRVFSTLLLEFKCSTEFMRDIGDHFVAAVLSFSLSLLICQSDEGGKGNKMELHIRSVQWKYIHANKCVCGTCCTHTEAVLLHCAVEQPPSLSAPQRRAESLKERLSTAVFVRGREGVSAWGLPACLARACPYCQPGPSLPLGTAGTLVLNQRPIYPRHTPPAK